jgi:regulatory protein YycI of two-component signal transduction system YycFG
MNLNIGGGYMEWEKAKTIVIVFLVILNSILGFLWYKNSLKYTLDDEQKKKHHNTFRK